MPVTYECTGALRVKLPGPRHLGALIFHLLLMKKSLLSSIDLTNYRSNEPAAHLKIAIYSSPEILPAETHRNQIERSFLIDVVVLAK